MPQLNTSDFKKGSKVIIEGDPYEMFEVNFVKPGKGQALYKTRLRNLLKGTILDRTYKSGDSLEAADIHRGQGQYLYKESAGFVFMDQETFDQYTISASVAGEKAIFLQDGMICDILFWNNQPIEFSMPQHVIMKVTYTEPAARGNTATNLTKPATVECGAQVNVPAFVDIGDVIKINTETMEYVERVRE